VANAQWANARRATTIHQIAAQSDAISALDRFPGSVQIVSGGSRKGSKGNAVRAREGDAHNAAAAPATVSGECPAIVPLGATLLGRRPETATREPGDLPPATVTRERVGRGVLASLVRLLCGPRKGESGPHQPKSR
jgi:hypothetical protein